MVVTRVRFTSHGRPAVLMADTTGERLAQRLEGRSIMRISILSDPTAPEAAGLFDWAGEQGIEVTMGSRDEP